MRCQGAYEELRTGCPAASLSKRKRPRSTKRFCRGWMAAKQFGEAAERTNKAMQQLSLSKAALLWNRVSLKNANVNDMSNDLENPTRIDLIRWTEQKLWASIGERITAFRYLPNQDSVIRSIFKNLRSFLCCVIVYLTIIRFHERGILSRTARNGSRRCGNELQR